MVVLLLFVIIFDASFLGARSFPCSTELESSRLSPVSSKERQSLALSVARSSKQSRARPKVTFEGRELF